MQLNIQVGEKGLFVSLRSEGQIYTLHANLPKPTLELEVLESLT